MNKEINEKTGKTVKKGQENRGLMELERKLKKWIYHGKKSNNWRKIGNNEDKYIKRKVHPLHLTPNGIKAQN